MAANLINRVPDKRYSEARGFNTRDARSAVSRVKAYRANNSRRQNTEPFRTEQRPGTGGFGSGLQTQIMRNQKLGKERRRAESFRPETQINREIYEGLFE